MTMTVEIPLDYEGIRHTLVVNRQDSALLKYQRDAFLRSLSHLSGSDDDNTTPHSAVELSLRYLEFLVNNNISKSAVKSLLLAIERDFFRGNDIHFIVCKENINPAGRRDLLRAYYIARLIGDTSNRNESALLKAAEHGEARLFAVFGGQGMANPGCVEDLADLYATYTPFLEDLIKITTPLLSSLSRLPGTEDHYHGRYLDLEAWLQNPATILDQAFIATAAVSFPIIGLLSLAHYCVSCHVLGKKPGELRSIFQGLAGHSQGIVVATGIALVDSWESFYSMARMVIEILFWIGFHCDRKSPRSSISVALAQGSLDNGEGRPSFMLSVRGLNRPQVDSILVKFNKATTPGECLHLALVNAYDNFVIAGPANSLVHLNNYLRAVKAPPDFDQSRVPFSQRKPTIYHHFLPISAPFHTSYLKDAVTNARASLSAISITADQLMLPVYHSRTGEDLRDMHGLDLVDVLVNAIACELCDWPTVLNFPNASHIIAFGNGSIGELVMKVKEGQGIRVVVASDLEYRDRKIGTKCDFFSPRLLESSTVVESWGRKFQPRLTQSPTGELKMDTKMSRLLGVPPVMVAGMTPTTVHWDVVSAIMNAGYHVELAGGGYRDADAMSAAIDKLIASVSARRGITCNLIYSSPKLIMWQIPMLRRLAQSGVPIDGLTIGAGIPSPDVVDEYINTLGLKHISFKPGSHSAIKQVVSIANAHPNFPILLQWTGGRGGGHHSFEDLHAPILTTYSAIRECSNIILVVGSGFGNSKDVYPYISGTWATDFGRPLMPFDGILLGSRMMVAREAHTSPAAKRLISETPGVPDVDWEKSYSQIAGGVVTVQSEMGQPVHKIATRGVLFWAEMDKMVFSLPRHKRVAQLMKHSDYIIGKLNDDYMKPWFGRNLDGDVVNLSEMTCAEVLHRLVSLMYVAHQKRWIDESYAKFFLDFSARLLERFPTNDDFDVSETAFDDPFQFLQDLITAYPMCSTQILNPEDVLFFLQRCKSRGQKPVNFIPSLDDDFELYFKKDSLWQSEDLDAVVDQDAGRVCILHGPVAARYSHDSDEPAKEILENITRGLVDMVQRDYYSAEWTPSSESGSPSSDSWPLATLSSTTTTMSSKKSPSAESGGVLFGALLEPHAWPFSIFGNDELGNSSTWIHALFSDEFILQGLERKQSPLRRVLQPSLGTSIYFDRENSGISIASEAESGNKSNVKIVCNNDVDISVELEQPSAYSDNPAVLSLTYTFNPALAPVRIIEVMEERNNRIKAFYSQLWSTENDADVDMDSTFYGREVTLTRKMLRDLNSTVERSYLGSETMLPDSDVFPISTGIIVAWDAITKPLLLRDIDGDLLQLVHQSNTFQYSEGAAPFSIGDVVTSTSHIQAVKIEDSGKSVVVEAAIERSGKLVMTVISTFLFKGSFDNFRCSFRKTKEPDMTIDVLSTQDEAILRDREWFLLHNPSLRLVGLTLLFRLQTHVTWKNKTMFGSMEVKGSIFTKSENDELRDIGSVHFQCDECYGNPVMDFLQRRGTFTIPHVDLTSPGWSGHSTLDVQIPNTNDMYARISKDYNPIHVSPIFAQWAELPTTITHGMYTSAITASVLEQLAADGDRYRFRRFSATFTGMVFPNDCLSIRFRHVGMTQGRMLFKVFASKKYTDEKVLDADAEIDQPTTAYIFTGQGSQAQGMGMDLYNTSAVAKAVWDDVDQYLSDAYGWSILDIIRNNPKALTVHFGGKRGRKIRENYLAMETVTALPNGQISRKPILENLTRQSISYTFTEPRGLLFSTQFAQPAILLLQKATFEDMRAKGLIQDNAIYAGHSLGEYGSLSAFSGFMPIKALMDVVFYRGLMMQLSMERDEHGETTFSMVAANPKRVGKFFNEYTLRRIVDMIAAESKSLLEIVNFNVKGEQYVCAGTLHNLHVLGETLTHLSKSPDQERLVKQAVDENLSGISEIGQLISGLLIQAEELARPVQLQRSVATIPLKGIDVPFHSTHLRAGVQSYRRFLQQRILKSDIHPDRLVGKFVPNIVARPFSLDSEYVKEVFAVTQSPVLKEILEQDSVW